MIAEASWLASPKVQTANVYIHEEFVTNASAIQIQRLARCVESVWNVNASNGCCLNRTCQKCRSQKAASVCFIMFIPNSLLFNSFTVSQL